MSKIFFTGASGFIGSHFHIALDQNDIINLDLVEPKFKSNSMYVKGDVRKFDDLDKALENNPSELIIALAAEHKDFGLTEADYFKTNEFGTENICKAATKHGIKKIIFYSSVAVYGGNTEPSTEEMPPNPNLPYGASKLAGEKVLLKWQSENKDRSVLIIRPTVVYGERNVANMFKLIDQINKGRYFHIGKGTNIKSIIYVKNIVDATLYLKDKMEPGVKIFNYADEPQMTSREIADIITGSLQKKEPINFPYWLVYLMAIPFDIYIKITGKDIPISSNRVKKFCTQTYHKADKILETGFKPKYSNIQGLNNMVQWMKKEYNEDTNYYDV